MLVSSRADRQTPALRYYRWLGEIHGREFHLAGKGGCRCFSFMLLPCKQRRQLPNWHTIILWLNEPAQDNCVQKKQCGVCVNETFNFSLPFSRRPGCQKQIFPASHDCLLRQKIKRILANYLSGLVELQCFVSGVSIYNVIPEASRLIKMPAFVLIFQAGWLFNSIGGKCTARVSPKMHFT